jgi:hypothetical protein
VRLADEFFLVALDDRTGRHRLAPRVLGLGLAGALLGELVLDGRVGITGERVSVVNSRPPEDALAHAVLDHLSAEAGAHPVRTWLVFLARTSRERVAERLWRAGHIGRVQPRRLLRTVTVYPPTDINTAYAPTARLANSLRQGFALTWPEAVLAGLVVATGLEGHVLYTADPAARDYLRHIVSHLTPDLHELTWQLHAAVGDAVLTGRTNTP